ncbi:MAG: enolase C-terminal domain-like protein, partial [Actinomycetota bacterium]
EPTEAVADDLGAEGQRAGIAQDGAVGAQVIRYRLGGLRHYKIKLSGDLARDRAKFRWFRRPIGAVVAHSVRVDANNLWGDPADAIAHLRALDQPLVGVEEPLAANDLDGFAHLSRAIDTPIILDESLLRPGQLERLPDDGARWILNCRVSKSGGLLRSLQLIEAAVDHGLGVIVGAHVGESSLLTRAGLAAAAAAGEALVAQEGAFGDRLLQHDLCAEPLMFGRAGRLGPDQLAVVGPHGLGIEVRPDRVRLDD